MVKAKFICEVCKDEKHARQSARKKDEKQRKICTGCYLKEKIITTPASQNNNEE